MRICNAEFEFVSPYSQGRYHDTPALPKESKQDYEKRTWKERLNTLPDGTVFIPPMALKNCLSEIAKYLAIQIPGKGKSTYTKHFEAGVLVLEASPLPFKKDDIAGEWLHVPSNGERGGGKRVLRCFPVIPAGTKFGATFHILDNTITEDVFEQHLREGGSFIGIGRFRPRNNGFYGRFKVTKLNWE